MRLLLGVVGLLLLAGPVLGTGRVRHPPVGPYQEPQHTSTLTQPAPLNSRLFDQCEERWRHTQLDHFSWANTSTFRQRYFVCDRYYRKKGGAVFFYLGNEANVELYLNNTGLMWELAPRHRALLVFAEHRYYGQSKPFGKHTRKHMQWLTTEQAMADYSTLIWELKEELGDSNMPVIGFGGSYGGMLTAWFRMKYPHLLDGGIAASAPIWTFLGEDPPADPGAFAKVVTRDAWPEGGSAHDCADNVRNSWRVLSRLGKSEEGRAAIARAMRLCNASDLGTHSDVAALRDWAGAAFDYMAMGDYPYPSSYMLSGNGELPAYPERVACSHLAEAGLDGEELLGALARAVGVFYNYSGTQECLSFKSGPNPETDETGDFWSYQYCTEQFMPFSKDGENDMFWPEPWDEEGAMKACESQWGVRPRKLWATTEWGGRRIEAASNIVFSNGLLDPWSGGGVLHNISDTLVAVLIPEGAHHLDLMFSNPLDPPSVKHARAVEEAFIARWIQEARERVPPTAAVAGELGRRGGRLVGTGVGPTAAAAVAGGHLFA